MVNKEKIISISNGENFLILKLPPTQLTLENFDKLVAEFNDFDYRGSTLNHPLRKKPFEYSEFLGEYHTIPEMQDAGIIFFNKTAAIVVLAKNSNLFDKLKDKFMKYFNFN